MLIEIKNVTKQYDGHKALDNVSFNIPKGSIFGLLGPNGAGKTSLIRILTQITGADEGEVLFDGEKLNQQHQYLVGYLPEERGLYKKMKVEEQILYLSKLKGLSSSEAKLKSDYWLNKFELTEWKNKEVEELSKGMQQKIQFITTVINEPELLILDEPFSGFDPVNANLIKDEIIELNQKGTTIIFSTHRMESVEELCSYIALIHKSKLRLTGELEEVRNQFKTNTYRISGKGNLELSSDYKIDKTKDGFAISLQGKTTKELLNDILKSDFELHHFSEILPSANDIFMKVVGSH